ncbi:ADYC domain-containing protein [Archangium sp.]|uniref:ADYC domain-containing protein n=1 Tax=Archangium sp. TaxID=1872627 RepID=UPI002D3DFBAC|nr:ADYC domain-containing protein [Archangium sp.]HYO52592.1 ADYC domain-containing protein [Archangium sp.]
MKRNLLTLACLLVGAPVLAATPRKETQPLPCQGQQAPQRNTWPNGTLLWGTARKVAESETSSVLASLDLGRVRLGGTVLKGVRLEEGRLVAPSLAPEGLVGAVLQGTASDGQPVEVALCGGEPAPHDPTMVRYQIEVWNAVSASWENPCIATSRVPSPRALAVWGVWDETGARRDVPGKFTFACENGAIAKCIDWGYKPWAKKDGHSLADLHQACTRMARADYCGDGRSHTREDNPIDMYDSLQVLTRTTEAVAGWEPARASFEAAWTPEGAACLARTRDGRAVETVLAKCPGRFEVGTKDLGGGDRCTVRRKGGGTEAALLRNHSYGKGEQASLQRTDP